MHIHLSLYEKGTLSNAFEIEVFKNAGILPAWLRTLISLLKMMYSLTNHYEPKVGDSIHVKFVE